MSSAVLAGPHGDACFKGVKHSGNPVGKTVEIAGISTYVAEPKPGAEVKGIILFFADIFGPFYVNNQLLQDYFAENGEFVPCTPVTFVGYGTHYQRFRLPGLGS